MEIDITIKNYRCFPDSRPARIRVRPGFTALVGVNNSGKSSLLRFFYEFRSLFQSISLEGNRLAALRGSHQVFDLPGSITDPNQVFCDSNDRDLEIEVRVQPLEARVLPVPTRLTITLPRGTNRFFARVDLPGEAKLDPQQFDFSDYLTAFRDFSEAFYIGPFRNAINVGTHENYFDIQVGQAFIFYWRTWKTGAVKKANEAAYRLTQDIKHIFDFGEFEINPSSDDTTLQVFISGKSYRLSELGSGLTQLILVFANAAVRSLD